MAIPRAQNPRILQRSTRYFTGAGWKETPVSSRSTGNVVSGVGPIAAHVLVGQDTADVQITVPGLGGSTGAAVTGVISFANIGAFTPGPQDAMQIICAVAHVYNLPAAYVLAGTRCDIQALQSSGGPAVTVPKGLPPGRVLNLAPGVTYRSVGAIVTINVVNTSVNPQPGGTITVEAICHIMNAPG